MTTTRKTEHLKFSSLFPVEGLSSRLPLPNINWINRARVQLDERITLKNGILLRQRQASGDFWSNRFHRQLNFHCQSQKEKKNGNENRIEQEYVWRKSDITIAHDVNCSKFDSRLCGGGVDDDEMTIIIQYDFYSFSQPHTSIGSSHLLLLICWIWICVPNLEVWNACWQWNRKMGKSNLIITGMHWQLMAEHPYTIQYGSLHSPHYTSQYY